MKGKFIVIEGIDGSGKGTQALLLVKRLRKEGKKVSLISFPRYDEPSSYFVQEYLRGAYGESKKVNPHATALFYALDRFAAAPKLRALLAQGTTVIADRYVASNIGHQGAKVPPEEQKKFVQWLTELEYQTLGVPVPDLQIFLDVPTDVAFNLIARKKTRGYLRGARRDVHERDKAHLQNAAAAYRHAIDASPGTWLTIYCAPQGKMRPVEGIHGELCAAIAKMIGLRS